MEDEKVPVTPLALYNLVKKFRLQGTIRDLPCCKMPQLLTEDMKRFMEEKLRTNDEIASTAMKTLSWRNGQTSVCQFPQLNMHGEN